MLETLDTLNVEEFVSALRRDYSKLSIRIRELTHSVECECKGVTLRRHFPTIVQGKATIWEFISAILDYITPFALHQSQIDEVEQQYGTIPAEQYRVKCERLHREAKDVFILAQREANKNGEAGELLLFILTEWILKAPQLLAKLPLKTNRQVPVHGTDGIHVGYWPEKKALCTYWGEAKLHANVNKAISSAAASIEKALQPSSTEFELALVKRNIDKAGLSPEAKSLLLTFLDPLEHENYNKRINVFTCLIGFNFDAYNDLSPDTADAEFEKLADAELRNLAPRIATALREAGLKSEHVELFLLPVPSVQDLRDQFQAKIGWANAPGPG